MAGAMTGLTITWCFRFRFARVSALRVAQGRTMPFFGEDVDMN
ncbi:hypothetical protein KDA_58130 [Dictyobacter alpinus]|uniref:Uncharacterized protein n=1 Tax=Dictyobacter alpinus TaxID=2014873 RepID=A0A402BG79_9CHLR|nr:hypothetical protein KDA_57810 [Dictyobacter alpinus]GCE30329.1 hypothetical protein KDA_58130 [Dictyobacter alpinus]